MKRLLAALVAVVVLLLLPGAVGMLLPVAHSARARAHIPAPPVEVWSVITDFSAHPTWRPDIERTEPLGERGGLPAWREVSDMGATDFVVEAATPPSRLVTRIVGEGLPYGGRWTVALAPADGGTRVTVTEHGEVYNPWFRSLSRFVFGHHGTMEAYLRALGRRFGGGEVDVERLESGDG